ncbi:MAG: protein-disulfide reductase DsbD domain-containing protein [Luteolibacter sp.]|uniref:protein-disulfide reductase DsbD domain-containing protein n=1 Tax=Luteolibacter sp. TaxID=1962973 RepID=UPI003265A7BA
MFAQTALIFASLCTVSLAAVKSGKASADWITSSKTCEAGMPVKTGLKLAVEEGWHTYWINPGESGMKISVKWELPDGWTAGAPEHPVPKRFTTSGLAGFGYEGTVVFPVTVTPPAGFTGEAKLKGKVSWLTCNDRLCVPGTADLELALNAGEPAPTADAKLIDAALRKIPLTPGNRITLKVVENPKTLLLTIEGLTNKNVNLGEYEVFPATPQVIDSAAKILFASDGAKWTAEVPKSEYATKAIPELTLVLAAKSDQAPISLTWKSAK